MVKAVILSPLPILFDLFFASFVTADPHTHILSRAMWERRKGLRRGRSRTLSDISSGKRAPPFWVPATWLERSRTRGSWVMELIWIPQGAAAAAPAGTIKCQHWTLLMQMQFWSLCLHFIQYMKLYLRLITANMLMVSISMWYYLALQGPRSFHANCASSFHLTLSTSCFLTQSRLKQLNKRVYNLGVRDWDLCLTLRSEYAGAPLGTWEYVRIKRMREGLCTKS